MPTFGDTSAGGDEFPCSGDRCLVDRFAMPDNGTVNFAQAYSGPSTTAGANWKFVIMSDALSLPDLVLYVSNATAINAASSWFNFTFSGSPSLTPADYWQGTVADSFQAYLGEDATGSSPNVQMANGTFSYSSPPASWPGSDANYGVGLNVYVDYSLAGGGAARMMFAYRLRRH